VRLVDQEHMTLFEDERRVSIHTDDAFARATPSQPRSPPATTP